MIQARGLSYSIGGNTLVDAVDLDVVPGQLLALVGANGAGKSTLLKLLGGELRPSLGSVELDGTDLRRLGPRELARRRAVLPQTPGTPPLTVAETVALGRTPHHTRNSEAVVRVLEESGLTPWAHRLVPTLSGGEVQKVHLARVRAQLEGDEASRYCFLDEPASAMDVGHQLELMERLRCWAAEGLGVVVVLHELNLAARFADRVAVMYGGKVAVCGAPREVLTEAVVAQAFAVRNTIVEHPVLGHPLVLPLTPI